MTAPAQPARRYVFIGAGAIGSGIGGLLADGGMDVVLVARGDHLDVMAADGLLVRTTDGPLRTRPAVAAGPDDVELRVGDVLVLTTKTHQAEAALAAWADAPVRDCGGVVTGTAGEQLPVLTALNGVASEEMALRWFARVIGVCVWMPAVLAGPGEVVVRATPARAVLHASRVPAALATDQDRDLLAAVAADWARVDVDVPTPPDVMPWKYRKLLGNLGNAVQALLGDRADEGDDVVERVREEAREVYGAAGVVVNDPADEQSSRERFQVRPVPGEPDAMGGSTWQSLSRGTGNAETDYLNGEIVAIAHRHGRSAPLNAALATLMREAVRAGARPGDLTPEQLRERLAG